MLYLKFLEGQGLGNQLWNYVTLRSLSNKLGYEYEIINPENFKGKSFLDISYNSNEVKQNTNSNILETNNKNIFREKLYYDKSLKTFASDFDEEILKIKQNTILNGLFQSEKYLFKYDVNDFIKVTKTKTKEKFKLQHATNIIFY